MDKVGRFEILGEIGRGSLGRVYMGRDPSSGRVAAVKVLYADCAQDARLVERFREEARILGLLSHPSITRIDEVGEHEGRPYIVMEHLDGDDLASLIRKRVEISVERRVEIVRRVAEALGYAHKLGVVHGDVKPANVKVLKDGTVRIMDFGMARLGAATPTGQVIGTAHYMSPEQVKGSGADARSDVFSLGCVLYEMLSGRRPFQSETLSGMLFAILSRDLPPIEEIRGTPHEWLNDVVSKCLQKDVAERFASGADVAEALSAGLLRPRPAILGRFEVLSTLADEAMSWVLKVRDPEDDRIYALRRFHTFDPEAYQRFRRTAKDASKVGHPAIVRSREFGEDHGLPYVVMDLVEGESLRNRLKGGQPCGVDASVDIVHGLLLALEAAHSQGIVHGEVDPTNIMVDAAGQVRLLAFGLLEVRDPGRGPELPRVCYYPPEKIDGERPDRRSDVFGAGLVLYELLSARRAFGGDDPYDVMQRILFKPAPPLDLPGSEGTLLTRVLEKALAKAPERRYATAHQMALDLDRYRLGRSGAAVAPAPRPRPSGAGTESTGAAFDVFLCHSFADKPAVRELSAALAKRGLRPWLDEEQLRPGLPWQEMLETQIQNIRAVAVIVGASGLGPWQDMELRAFLNEFVRRGCPVIPVLLDSCPGEPKLPIFLSRMTWVDFRCGDPDPMARLVWGITGSRPEP